MTNDYISITSCMLGRTIFYTTSSTITHHSLIITHSIIIRITRYSLIITHSLDTYSIVFVNDEYLIIVRTTVPIRSYVPGVYEYVHCTCTYCNNRQPNRLSVSGMHIAPHDKSRPIRNTYVILCNTMYVHCTYHTYVIVPYVPT